MRLFLLYTYFPKQNISFKAALPTVAVSSFSKTVKEAKNVLGISDGISMLDIPTASLYQKDSENTGSGKLLSDEAMDYFLKMKVYTDVNAVKVYPSGRMTKHYDHYYGPYNKSALTIGEENINLFKLSESTYGQILPKTSAEEFVKSNEADAFNNYINYENELGTTENYPVLKPLREAFENFKSGNSSSISALKNEFEQFKSDTFTNNYDRLAVYPYVKDSDPELFVNFDNDPNKQQRFEELKQKYSDDIEFFKFNQFIAQKQLLEAKKELNKENLDLIGDCLIGFSDSEKWAFPDAFDKGATIGWGLPILDYSTIKNENSPSHKLFKDKVSFFLKNYDGIRFDVGWSYTKPYIEKNGEIFQPDMEDYLFGVIEQTAKEIKGEDYDTRKLMYELEASPQKFAPFVWAPDEPPGLIDALKGRVGMFTTEHAHTQGKYGYGSVDFFKRATSPSQNEFIAGTNNHDGTPLRVLSEAEYGDMKKEKEENISSLSKALNIPKDTLYEPKNFVRAKFAELFTTKNQFVYFIDLFGGRADINNKTADTKNFRYRLNSDYEREYHTALQEGNGFNLMESLKIAMKAKGADKVNPKIYEKVCLFADYLRLPGAKTQDEADSFLPKFFVKDTVLNKLDEIDRKYSFSQQVNYQSRV